LIRGQPIRRAAPIFWEHDGHKAVRDGKWKLVNTDIVWELYDMEKGRTELRDLAKADPARVKSMDSLWQRWADSSNVRKRPAPVSLAETGRRAARMGGDLNRKRTDALGRRSPRH
jgi:arylsulfatase